MSYLTPQQRNALESAVELARKVSETGAFNALQAMAVDQPEPFTHMSPQERALRNNLRSKARLLGDKLESNGVQQINKLAYELAYETWHKMLFAKFLEANNLLMHPDGVAVSFEYVEELAKDEGYADKWDAAAGYASKMLPAIFRPEDPLMQVPFSTNDRIRLEGIIDGLESSVFTADDALGWVYQFWQSEAKAEINASGDKIDGEKLPAVTQLFTEPYMVHFLIDNTLGAWWVSRNPGVKPPVKFEYLRMHKPEAGLIEVPAAGCFEGWPDKTAEVTSLDPCMGSGHFVTSLFSVFVALRMHEENLSKAEAIDKVIVENIYGLEIDARCTQLAAFNLALIAWKFNGQYKVLPEMNLACCGIAPTGKKEDWIKLVSNVEDPVEKARMQNGMQLLYSHFQLAPELGSLIDPSTIRPDAFIAGFDQLKPALLKALGNENDNDLIERGVVAAGIAKAGQLLSKKYTLQITNVPYLSRGKQEKIIADYSERNYPDSKGDLATVFYEKMINSSIIGGTACCVMPQNWLTLTSYTKFRKKLIENKSWSFVARLGTKCFSTPMFDFNVVLISIQNLKHKQDYFSFTGLDVAIYNSISEKTNSLKTTPTISVNQEEQLKNPDIRIVISNEKERSELKKLSHFANCNIGLHVGDWMAYRRNFWEVSVFNNDWKTLVNSVSNTLLFGGCDDLLFWPNEGKMHIENENARVQGFAAWGKRGVAISMMAQLPATLYHGGLFRNGISIISPKKAEHLIALWAYLSSYKYNEDVRKIDQKLYVTTSTLVKVPFDIDYWSKVALEEYPNGLPKPYSDDPTQWLFHGHPIKTDNSLQVSVARLLGYRWPSENDTQMELADEAQSLIAEVKSFDYLSDDDGIFCIPSVNTEHAGSDRLREYLQIVFADVLNAPTVAQLLQKEGANSANLADWLRNEFFIQHCKVFQNRPFIWHIWDGRKDGFSALVNYHMLTKENLSKLIYTYLGDWIRMCDAKKKSGESGAEGLLSAAVKLKDKLELILKGEAPYDIFVRWKTLAQQPIGWEPDLNDGVRLNIRPFVEAGVLRSKFNIKWGIDRGKNSPGSPWGEIRDNDLHLSLDEKRAAKKD
jgi:hypothetical protein